MIAVSRNLIELNSLDILKSQTIVGNCFYPTPETEKQCNLAIKDEMILEIPLAQNLSITVINLLKVRLENPQFKLKLIFCKDAAISRDKNIQSLIERMHCINE